MLLLGRNDNILFHPNSSNFFGLRASKHCPSCTLRPLLTLNLPIGSLINLVMFNHRILR
jgi:hypothetical protein